MERLTSQRFVPAVVAARALVPPGVARRLHYHIFTGDPLWAGLHDYEDTDAGNSYRRVPHAVYPCHQWGLPRARRVPTIVLPRPMRPEQVVHEIGHILDEVLGFQHVAEPVSRYAKTNSAEAFAEAFTAWLVLGFANVRVDGATLRLFSDLTGEGFRFPVSGRY